MSRKVFIGHTSLLAEFPKGHSFVEAAIAGAKEAGWDYDEMHRFPSAPQTPAEECRRRVSQCDAYVGILGPDWGSEPPDVPGVSYTQYEFQVAQKLMEQRTVLFLTDPNTTAFPLSVTDAIPPGDREKQNKFRTEHGLHAKRVLMPSDLRREVADALRGLTPPSPPLGDLIQSYEAFIKVGEFTAAWRCFQYDFKLNYRLDFELSWHTEHLRLLLMLFPSGIENNPALDDVNDIAGALNALARAYKNVGQPGKAVNIFRRELELQKAGTLHRVMGLANLTNTLRLTGRFSEAEDAAGQLMIEASRVNDPKWEAYSLYWNGILCSESGSTDEAVLLLRQAQVLFEHLQDRKASAAGRGRTYAHLAQLELWLGNAMGALCFGRHAQQLANEHDEGREFIFTARLIGAASMRLADQSRSLEDLNRAVRDAQACSYWEEWLAATISLAELQQRKHTHTNIATRDLLNAEVRCQAESGPYAMLLADFDIALCEILRSSNRRDLAIEAAKRALVSAVGDKSPHHYHWGALQAKRQLLELGEPQPEMPPLSTVRSQISPADILGLDEHQKMKAELRARFTEFIRSVTGHYRYAPAKFARLLREDWKAIRSLIEGRDITVPPQFVELHVGHPCNLNCSYCRGKLREKPDDEVFLGQRHIANTVKEIYRTNPNAFIRFSGLIGEPLLHADLVEIFEMMGKKGEARWGITTNGIRMEGPRLLRSLLKAKHVHVSVDAGSNETYRTLKGGGHAPTFDKVIHNITELAKMKSEVSSETKIVASFLLQTENYRELPGLALALKKASVDSIEVKMQHFDSRRGMSEDQVNEAYQIIGRVQRELSDEKFHVVVVQTQSQAVDKIRLDAHPIRFEKCYANLLGLSPTIDPTGNVQMCCQYYQRTLGAVGSIKQKTFDAIWNGRQRQSALKQNPCDHCINCSPSDDFVNRFVQFLKDAYRQDATFLDWVEQEVKPLLDATTNE